MKIMGLDATLSIKMPPLPTLENYGLDPKEVLEADKLQQYIKYTNGINKEIFNDK